MADIHPFRGVHYSPAKIKDLAAVICPPYDVITPQRQQALYQRSEINFVRLEYGLETPQDKDTDNKYTRAAATLEKWRQQGILEADKAPAIYIDDHEFRHEGKVLHRRGIHCLVKLEEWGKMVVRPHEGTLSRPRSDRLNLLWALQADVSPVMALYEDRAKKLTAALETGVLGPPMLRASTVAGESHRLWAVTEKTTCNQIRGALADQPLYIADGHHRYESALAYQRERRSLCQSGPGTQPYDFVLMMLVEFTDPGLIILPAHRLARGIAPAALDTMFASLKTIFQVEDIPAEISGRQQIDELITEGTDEVRLLIYGPGTDRALRLTLRDFSPVRSMIPYFHSDLYQRLDVSIVDHVILEELLGLTHEAAGTYLEYVHDAMEAIKRVREHEYQLAVIVNAVKARAVKAIADSGDRMPRKSTYFYPKVPAGLVFYRFA